MSIYKTYFKRISTRLKEWSSDPSKPYNRSPYHTGEFVLLSTGVINTPSGYSIIDIKTITNLIKNGKTVEATIIFGGVEITGEEDAKGLLIERGRRCLGEVPSFKLFNDNELNHNIWVSSLTSELYFDFEHMLVTALSSDKMLDMCHMDLYEISKLLGDDIDIDSFYRLLIEVRKTIIELKGLKK